MSNNSSRIAVSNILTPLANDVERERRLIKAGESFDQRNKETIERDRDELRRSGIVAADWTPNETNADHGYWDAWSERLRKVADKLEAAGEAAIAGQLLTFCGQIDGRDEVTCESDFRFEKLADCLAAVMDGDKKDDGGDRTPSDPAPESQNPKDKPFQWTVPLLEGHVFALLKEVEYPTEREAAEWIATKSRKHKPSRATLRKTYAWQNRPQKTPKPRTTNEAQSGVSPAQNADPAVSHEEVTDAILDIGGKLHRQLVDNERDAVAWTLQQAGADKEERDQAIRQLIQGFRSGDM